ncbi:uncharacterized protein LOC125869880 [Solanum stenotomum]|uniref:uncharacterized protein LOC125869880 n=1 Tax=Solanum stenotomum TaxID=172797 RepID=UPI0020D0C892|nr:uncharacterized protein LOC125869880 [Solanum stenotomum]
MVSNREIKQILAKTVNTTITDWSIRIDDALWSYRTTFETLIAFESSALYKEKMKKYLDEKIKRREFVVRDLVLLFNSRLGLFPGKIKSKWTGPFNVTQVFQHGAVELENKEGTRFKVNGQMIKVYLGKFESVDEVIEAYYLDEV